MSSVSSVVHDEIRIPVSVEVCYGWIVPASSSGWYQIGEVHARSWITLGMVGSLQVVGRSSGGRLLQSYVLQRHVGFSTTRA